MKMSKDCTPVYTLLIGMFCFCMSVSGAEWVPVHKEPQHRQVFENEQVRILDVELPPGYVSLYHKHLLDLIYVTVSGSTVWAQPLNGQKRQATVNAGDLRFSSDNHDLPHIHRVGNIGDTPFRVIGVGIKGERDKSSATPALTGDIRGLKQEIERSHAAVYRITLKPGESTGLHSHNLPVTEVFLTEGQRLSESGETVSIVPGEFRWQAGGFSHKHENKGDQTVEIIEIQWR